MFSKKNRDEFYPIILLLLQCAIFGFSFIVLQKLISFGCPTFLLICIRFFIGAMSLFLFSIVVPSNNILSFKISYSEIMLGIISGITMLIAFVLQTYGAVYTSASNNALFTGIYVIFVPVILFTYKKEFNLRLLFYSLICAIGVAFISNFTFINFAINYGDVLSIACGFAFAIHFILLEKFTSTVNLSSFTIIQLFSVSLMSGLISLGLERRSYYAVDWSKAFFWLVFLGIISTAITYLIQSYVQSHLTATSVSIISCSESIFAVAFSILLGYENISFHLFLGFIFIILSMFLVSIDNKKGFRTKKNNQSRKLKMENKLELFRYILFHSLSPIFLPASVAFAFLLSLLFNRLQNNQDNSMLYLIAMFIFGALFCVTIFIYIRKQVANYIFEKKQQELKLCQSCIKNQDKYIFNEYGLITLKEIIKREEMLNKGSKVYNYTILDDTTTDQNVKNIVMNNLSKGVIYKEFYVDKAFEANEDNVKLYGSENLFYCRTSDLFRSAWFDVVLHITPDRKFGYAAVNFTPVHGECDSCPYSKACHNKHDDTLYKVLSDNAVAYLYKQMNLIIKNSLKPEDHSIE